MSIETTDNSHKTIVRATGVFGFVQVFKMLVSIVGAKFIALFLGPVGIGIFGLLNNTLCYNLDAAGYAIKKAGTSCFMLPETFDFIDQFAKQAQGMGMEVLVEILEGDPDKPVVVAKDFNSKNAVPNE